MNEVKILGILYSNDNQNIVEQNLSGILAKISQEITQWKRRHLTLIGKVTVVKALLISKLVHIFTALPNPSHDIIKNIKNTMFKFVWNNGPDKVKRKKLIQHYDRGSLRMVDIASFIKSLKISWIKRLYWAKPNVIWAENIKEKLPPIDELVCFSSAHLKKLPTTD